MTFSFLRNSAENRLIPVISVKLPDEKMLILTDKKIILKKK